MQAKSHRHASANLKARSMPPIHNCRTCIPVGHNLASQRALASIAMGSLTTTDDGGERYRQPRKNRGGNFLPPRVPADDRSEEHTSELQSLKRISYAVFCLKKKTRKKQLRTT